MLFNSLTFAYFLILVFAGYWWLGKKQNGRKLQNLFILIASYVFYGWWNWGFLSLIVISSLTDYVVGLQLGKAQQNSAHQKPGKQRPSFLNNRKALLGISLFVNLGMLAVFKYYNFFVESLVDLFSLLNIPFDVGTLDILLPVGISFYTFQTLSYTIDIYRGKMEPVRDPISFFAFVSFFPQLVAGPIERAADLLPQFQKKRVFDYGEAVQGLRLILWGIFKKVVIADRLAEYVEAYYSSPADFHGWEGILAVTFFVIQLYCDFSAYSDIAIGTARLFGFKLTWNFNKPLFASSLSSIWQRWHITLLTWFRDYLYFPLGGSRRGNLRTIINLAVVFFISGLWHGAAYTYILWAMLNWFGQVVEKLLNFPTKPVVLWQKFLGWTWTMFVFVGALIFFRSNSVPEAIEIYKNVFTDFKAPELIFGHVSELNIYMSDASELVYLFLIIGFVFTIEAFTKTGNINEFLNRLPRPGRWGFYYLLISVLLLMGAYGVPQRFIYFQF